MRTEHRLRNLPRRIAVLSSRQQNNTLIFQIYQFRENRLLPTNISDRERRGADIFLPQVNDRSVVDPVRMDLEGIGPCILGFTEFSLTLRDDIPFHNPQTINNNYYNNYYTNNFLNDEIPIVFVEPVSYHPNFYLPITDIVEVLDFNNSVRNCLFQMMRIFRDDNRNLYYQDLYPEFGIRQAGRGRSNYPGGAARRRSISRSLTPPPARIPEIQIQIAPAPAAVAPAAPAKISERVALALARDGIAQKEVCPIGQVPLTAGRVAVTSCHCVFQAESLEPWAETKTTCPTCRSPLDFRIVNVL